MLGAAALAEGISRFRAAKVVFWVFTLVFATSVRCSPLTTIAMPGFLVDSPSRRRRVRPAGQEAIYDRRDLRRSRPLPTGSTPTAPRASSATLIPHDMLYCPDHFKNCLLPEMPINDKLALPASRCRAPTTSPCSSLGRSMSYRRPLPQTFVGNGELSHKLNERFLAVRERVTQEATFDMAAAFTLYDMAAHLRGPPAPRWSIT